MTLNYIMSKYKVLGKKGEGTFSEVMKCQNIKEGTFWACKKMKQQYESNIQWRIQRREHVEARGRMQAVISLEQANSLREVQAMRRLSDHANILQLNEILFDKKSGTLVLICELMDMNIYELIKDRRHYLPEKKVQHYMYQLCKSIDYMHRNGIFHRDIKPENILIKDDLLKLADFGSCRSIYSKQPYTEYISTRWYRAPECLLTDGYYSHKMDIWSVGCVIYEVISLRPLFPGANELDQIAKIHDVIGTPDPAVLAKLRNKARGVNFNFPAKTGSGLTRNLPLASKECVDLIAQLCTYDPDERISAKHALRLPYFKEFRDADKREMAIINDTKPVSLTTEKERHVAVKENIAKPQDQPSLKLKDPQRQPLKSHNSLITTTFVAPHVTHPKKDNSNNSGVKPSDSPLKASRSSDVIKDENQEQITGVSGKGLNASINDVTKEKPSADAIDVNKFKPSSWLRPHSRRHTPGAKYPGSILHNRDPVYQLHRRRRKRLRRMAESGPSPEGASLLPHVAPPPKPASLQASPQRRLHDGLPRRRPFETSPLQQPAAAPRRPPAYQGSTAPPAYPPLSNHSDTATHGTSLPKLTHTGTGPYISSLSQAFLKPSKAKASRNIYGHYQLPSIDRRGAGY